MRKKYRIKVMTEDGYTIPAFVVQVRAWWCAWVNVKEFYDPWDTAFARREAEELLDELNE